MSTSSSRLDLNFDANSAVPAWKHELNERLQATRTRHARRAAEQQPPGRTQFPEQLSNAESRAARLAAKVAARYANAPSYSEILAEEARIAAEAARYAAQHASSATQALLAGVETPKQQPAANETPVLSQAQAQILPQESQDARPSELLHPVSEPGRDSALHAARDSACKSASPLGKDSAADPLDDAMVFPAQPLPVNLIEFPRELVAARKARPRLAEGPLRESFEETAHDQSQLRIFEVESENISKTVKLQGAASEWSSIRLDARPASIIADEERSSPLEIPLESAPLEDRLMAGIFDAALVLFAFVLFVFVFAACTAHPPSDKPALLAGGLVLAGLFLLYQYLFFRFTEGTPGMRYAKIALCTFEDENPTRKAMRRRILFLALSAAPLGLGFAWACFDADRLGWHDRLSRMYQRSYR